MRTFEPIQSPARFRPGGQIALPVGKFYAGSPAFRKRLAQVFATFLGFYRALHNIGRLLHSRGPALHNSSSHNPSSHPGVA